MHIYFSEESHLGLIKCHGLSIKTGFQGKVEENRVPSCVMGHLDRMHWALTTIGFLLVTLRSGNHVSSVLFIEIAIRETNER